MLLRSPGWETPRRGARGCLTRGQQAGRLHTATPENTLSGNTLRQSKFSQMGLREPALSQSGPTRGPAMPKFPLRQLPEAGKPPVPFHSMQQLGLSSAQGQIQGTAFGTHRPEHFYSFGQHKTPVVVVSSLQRGLTPNSWPSLSEAQTQSF